jgi:beta-lactamase class A
VIHIRRYMLALLVVVTLCPWSAGEEPVALKDRLTPLAKAHKGKVAIAVVHLGTDGSYYLNADEPMPTASLIKLAVMVEVYQQAAEERVKLTDMITLRDADKVPGSGILTAHFSDGAQFSLRDAVRLMIVYSDNTATNLVLDKIGIRATADRMKAWGFPNTKIHSKVFRGQATSVFPERSKRFGLGSTSAREMVGLVEKLHTGKLVSPKACQEMLDHLKKCEDRDKFTRLLPPKTVVAHKTGSLESVRTDAGIIETPAGPVFLCVMTADNEDHRWEPDNAGNVFCARVAKEVYDYYAAQAPQKKKDK